MYLSEFQEQFRALVDYFKTDNLDELKNLLANKGKGFYAFVREYHSRKDKKDRNDKNSRFYFTYYDVDFDKAYLDKESETFYIKCEPKSTGKLKKVWVVESSFVNWVKLVRKKTIYFISGLGIDTPIVETLFWAGAY